MDDEEWKYFFEVFDHLPRGGPGSNATTRKAYHSIGTLPEGSRILDVGCGPGMQTLELARLSGGHVTAIDLHQPFLDRLRDASVKVGLEDRIEPVNMDMSKLTFPDCYFDLIWSEGALYSVGFENALRRCHRVLKEGRYLAASEGVLFNKEAFPEERAFWTDYPDVADVDGCVERIERAGFEPVSHFRVPRKDWCVHFYTPMKARLREVRRYYSTNPKALALFDSLENEIVNYEKFSDVCGYVFFIMRKT